MSSIDGDFIKLSHQLRAMSDEVETLRKKHGDLNREKHRSTMMLNYVMKKVKEVDFDIDEYLSDDSLLTDCLMITNDDKPIKLFYDFSKLKAKEDEQ